MSEPRHEFTAEEARRFGEEIGIDWASAPFDVAQFQIGMNVELEHGLRDAAGEPIRCECCLRMIESADDAAEKDGTLVHAGDCEQQWGSAYDAADDDEDRRGGARRGSLTNTVRLIY